jgi:hypothetical protein
MTTASMPKGRKNTILASSAASRYAPHHVRKKRNAAWNKPIYQQMPSYWA